VSTTITNYDGGIVTTPQQHVHPKSVQELQEILRDRTKYPSPVRAMGSNHSLTPCAASTGTVVSMDGFTKIVKMDTAKKTLMAQGGLQLVDAAAALRKMGLQFMLNIEIGNITLGSAACCQTKDSLDGVELGQVNSYVTGIKWVSPSGELMEASESENPELLPYIRASYGLAGIVYEVTFKLKPLEIISFDYDVHDVEDLTDSIINKAISSNQTILLWTVGDNIVIQSRNKAKKLKHEVPGRCPEIRLELSCRIHRPRHSRLVRRVGRRQGQRARARPRTGVLPSAQRRRWLHAGGARQDHQLLENAAVGALCVHVLGVPAQGLCQEREGLR
jgi:UDP-N-acetylenolpyruvoylglucosamine reductase